MGKQPPFYSLKSQVLAHLFIVHRLAYVHSSPIVLLSAIIFTNVSKVELGKLLNFFETHDIISTIWVDNRVLWVWPNIGPFRP